MSAAADPIADKARLLRHLGQAGAFAILSPVEPERLSLLRAGAGATLGAGHVTLAAGDALVAEGLACWSGTGRQRRLALAGGARAAEGTLGTATIVVEGRAAPVLIDERESPLLWLHRRKDKDGKPQISESEFAAGERFRADLTLAQMLPRTTMNWSAALTPEERAPGARDPAGASDAALAARQRVRLACDRLGPELSGLAIDVCGFLKGLDLVERERRWPARSAKIVLRLALAALAAHYRLDRVQRRPGRVAAWRAADARPAIPPAPP